MQLLRTQEAAKRVGLHLGRRQPPTGAYWNDRAGHFALEAQQ